jgi:uncharacterized protein
MLIEFRVNNYRSIKNDLTLSFQAGTDKSKPENLIERGKYRLLKSIVLYGANASGKSNVLKALEVMQQFVVLSATKMNMGDPISDIVPYRLDSQSAKAPTTFEVCLLLDGIRYEYGFSATVEGVHSEWLTAYPKGRAQHWLERDYDKKTGETEWHFRGPLKRHAALLKERTRDNGLVLSVGVQQNVVQLQPLYLWFSRSLWSFDFSRSPEFYMKRTAQRMAQDESLRARAEALVRDADTGVCGIRADVVSYPMPRVDPGFGPSLMKGTPEHRIRETRMVMDPESPLELTDVFVTTLHRQADTGGIVEFDMEADESNGTQRLFAIAGPWLDALNKGALIVADELECSMHPLLTAALIEMFQNPEMNKNGAQLLFATHDTVLMSDYLFRRDQICFVERYPESGTELTSLYDFRAEDKKGVRKSAAWQRNYISGRYGGTPIFGPVLEEAEITE